MSSFALGKYAGPDGSGQPDFFSVTAKGSGYDDNQIEKISDGEGGQRTEMPTAVPSPFARFDLVQTAFKNICKNDNLIADSGKGVIRASKFDERIVSHTLDLAEYIFNSRARGGNLEILTWRKKEHLEELKKSASEQHKSFAKSIELYLSQDAQAYNFNEMERIYLFKCNNDVIGSTSPVTLFCPSAANLKGLDIRRIADRSQAFGDDFLPLYKRTSEFQKWFYCLLAKCKKELSDSVQFNLRYIFDYAVRSLGLLNNKKLADELSGFDIGNYTQLMSDYESDYESVDENSPLDILGVELRIGKQDSIEESLKDSDFVIQATTSYEDARPYLALQDGFALPGWDYLRGLQWQSSFEVPRKVGTNWRDKRDMPGFKDIKGYYLTAADLLEPYLVRTIYPVSDKFYRGSDYKKDEKSKGYLIPLTPIFFKFFKVEDLIAGENDESKPRLALDPQKNGDVKVTLRIPLKKGNMTFNATYKYSDTVRKPDETHSDGGVIIEAKIGATIFPFVRVDDNVAKVKYRVQLVDADKTPALLHREYGLEFSTIDNNNIKSEVRRRFNKNDGSGDDVSTSDYYRVDGGFDLIRLTINNPDAKAYIIPKWPTYKPTSNEYVFSVDFGTTNTHIAYKTDEDSEPKAFELRNSIATVYDETYPDLELLINGAGADDIMSLIDREFVPREIAGKESKGGKSIFAFPQRTAMAYNKNLTDVGWNDGDGLDVLMEGNIPFGYEKTSQFGNVIGTDLKWGGSESEKYEKMRRAYLEEIVMLIQAKVLSENGDLKKTKFVWSYPGSMARDQIRKFKKEWSNYFSQYFCGGEDVGDRVVSVMEALTPYYAQNHRKHFGNAAVISIDIGGGTTDIAIFNPENGASEANLKAISSFKFAGNALFGDGYAEQAVDRNGFVIRYAPYFAEKLKGFPKPLKIFEELRKSGKATASNINTFMFSVENSIDFWADGKEITKKMRDEFSLTEELRESDDLKFLILYFYAALLYHLSKILKADCLTEDGKPIKVQYLMFSGTASKMLNILRDKDDDRLEDFTKKVFKELGVTHNNLEIIFVPDPKEITCNGALRTDIGTISSESANSKKNAEEIIYTCIKGREYDKTLRFSDYQNGLESIEAELVDFHEFFFKINEDDDLDFEDSFGINKKVTKFAQEKYKSLIEGTLRDSIGRNQPRDEDRKPTDDAISETSFFMPLKSIILDLSEQIVKMKK